VVQGLDCLRFTPLARHHYDRDVRTLRRGPRMAVKASWPGVSYKGDVVCPEYSTLLGADVLEMSGRFTASR
jgi:hypothetical protein